MAGKEYAYKVLAVYESDAEANSALSTEASGICALAQPVLKATNISSSGKIKLTWDKIEGAAKYEIYRATSKTGTYTKLSTSTGSSLTNTSADAGKTYTYRLYEINDGRESVTYSTAVHTIDIALSIDADNRIIATLTQNGKPVEQVTAHFENIYAAGSVPPQTGDRCQPLLWMALMLISLTGMALMMRRMVRR